MSAVQATIVGSANKHVFVLQTSAANGQALQASKIKLQEAEGSFRPLSTQDKLAARPWVIKTTPYPKGGFAELAKTSPIARPEQQLRLINGFYGGGEPPVGTLVKTISTK
jgi:predicted Zn-dependent protease